MIVGSGKGEVVDCSKDREVNMSAINILMASEALMMDSVGCVDSRSHEYREG